VIARWPLRRIAGGVQMRVIRFDPHTGQRVAATGNS